MEDSISTDTHTHTHTHTHTQCFHFPYIFAVRVMLTMIYKNVLGIEAPIFWVRFQKLFVCFFFFIVNTSKVS